MIGHAAHAASLEIRVSCREHLLRFAPGRFIGLRGHRHKTESRKRGSGFEHRIPLFGRSRGLPFV
jgi:hypothetical protein